MAIRCYGDPDGQSTPKRHLPLATEGMVKDDVTGKTDYVDTLLLQAAPLPVQPANGNNLSCCSSGGLHLPDGSPRPQGTAGTHVCP